MFIFNTNVVSVHFPSHSKIITSNNEAFPEPFIISLNKLLLPFLLHLLLLTVILQPAIKKKNRQYDLLDKALEYILVISIKVSQIKIILLRKKKKHCLRLF